MNRAISALGALACLTLAFGAARADDAKKPAEAAPSGSATAAPAPDKPPAKTSRAKEKLPPLPVKLTLVASSPDPPWKLRIENVGENRIRIPADRRLLSLELSRASEKAAKKSCSVPGGMRPSSFPKSRELYLDPGDAWEEELDPRLYCFGATTDALRDGVSVTPRFGFGRAATARGSFAAQGTDRPATFAAQGEITGDAITLPAPPKPTAPAPDAAKKKSAGAADQHKPGKPDAAPPAKDGAPPVDRNAADLEIFVARFSDAGNPRDLVLTIRASNEGRRALATVVRSRMLAFHVEELGTDDKAIATTDCSGQDNPHAIPIEAVSDVRPGREIKLPILVAEVCPRATFARPGLYRITATLDTNVSGEITKVDPLVATTLARQPSLVRIWSSAEPFYADPPTSVNAAKAKTNAKNAPPSRAAGPHASNPRAQHAAKDDGSKRAR